MAVKIRLRRMGKKKSPYYRIVVADSRSKRDGRFIQEIGTYDPNTDPSTFKIDEESAVKWLSTGAQPTDVVAKLFKLAGISKEGAAKKEAPAEAPETAEAAPEAESPAGEAAPEAEE